MFCISEPKEIAPASPNCLDHLVASISDLQDALKGEQVVRTATLGPAGTSSDMAAQRFAQALSCDQQGSLHANYEDAAAAVVARKADYLIVANAYAGINRFYISDQLVAAGVFPMKTPPYGIAVQPQRMHYPAHIRLVSHPAPMHLLDRWLRCVPHRADVFQANSTSEAAHLVATGKADACITTETACRQNGLAFITQTVTINMLWTVFVRRDHRIAHCLFGE